MFLAPGLAPFSEKLIASLIQKFLPETLNKHIFYFYFAFQSTFISHLTKTIMATQNKRLAFILLSIPLLLLIPFIAMQFTSEVNWSPFDFLVMGILLLGTGMAFELVLRKVKKTEHRIALSLAVLVIFFLIWAELAVGIIGTPFAGS
ncbi:MAG: hypothetical protein KDD06_25715 [Phaeodactylibacter sp.]|nr:hypothetical protein [Phaeodactylibacter sp.]